jgi:hypothetical protein
MCDNATICVAPRVWHSTSLPSAYVSIRQHTSAYVNYMCVAPRVWHSTSLPSAYVSIRQHTPAYVSMPQLLHMLHLVSGRSVALDLARRFSWRYSSVSICTFVLVKQVN